MGNKESVCLYVTNEQGVEVRGAHPSKTANGGAASFVIVLRWASQPRQTRARMESISFSLAGSRRRIIRSHAVTGRHCVPYAGERCHWIRNWQKQGTKTKF